MSRPALVATVGVLAIVIGAWLGSSGRVAGPGGPMTSGTGATGPVEAGSIEVHVAGWVRSPGVVRLPEGAIVADAVEAAGGFKRGAASHAINLAAPVSPGDQIVVSGPETGEAAISDDGLVVVNRAGPGELETLPGVGPVLAERIVAHREENGPFTEVEDLLDVPGIGESKLQSIRDLIRVP